jgi:hypothetical protein
MVPVGAVSVTLDGPEPIVTSISADDPEKLATY